MMRVNARSKLIELVPHANSRIWLSDEAICISDFLFRHTKFVVDDVFIIQNRVSRIASCMSFQPGVEPSLLG